MSNDFSRLCGQFLTVCLILSLFIVFAPSDSFSQLALGRTKFVGNAVTNGSQIPSNFLAYWNQVTPGNNGKWGSVESNQGVYNWGGLDAVYNFAVLNGLPFKEHCLIWGAQRPSFMTCTTIVLDSTVVDTLLQLPAVSNVTLKVYDVLGRTVANLVNEKQNAGFYNVAFDVGAYRAVFIFID
jgi:GH35 family endo-1,4-beta-xylanase